MIDKGIKTGLYTGVRYFGEARLLQAMQGSCRSEPARESFCSKHLECLECRLREQARSHIGSPVYTNLVSDKGQNVGAGLLAKGP
ncbi:hypothetical protein PS838_04278 [Pseudomonas fluorescens]|nr:hypothetical protein PS838_04278 [Pseudomonas fluorescens]